MPRIAKKLIPVGVVLLIAGAIWLYFAVTQSVPRGVTAGGFDCTLVEKEPQIALRLNGGDPYELPREMYIFRPDGGLVVAFWDEATMSFISNEPGCAYFVKGDAVYLCNVLNKAREVGTRGEWRVFRKITVSNSMPYFDETFKVYDEEYPITVTQEKRTWDYIESGIKQQLAQ